MIPEKKKPVLLFFAIVYAVFGVALVYLFFLNTGMDFAVETGGNELRVFLVNNSVHLIRDINVSIKRENGAVENLPSIAQLKPREKVELQLPDLSKEKITIFAVAPFHAKISKEVSVERTRGARLNYEVVMQNQALVGTEITATIKICNQGDPAEGITIVEMHSKEFFNEETSTQTISLASEECKKFEFALSPKQTGVTTIYFKISTAGTSQETERNITILER